jgi:hypothetical protein
MRLKVIVAAATFYLAFVAPVSAATLTAAELYALAPGRYEISIYGYYKMVVSMQPGGSISGETVKKKKRDSGSWSVNGNKLCIRWNRWQKKKTNCATVSGKNGIYSSSVLSIRKI